MKMITVFSLCGWWAVSCSSPICDEVLESARLIMRDNDSNRDSYLDLDEWHAAELRFFAAAKISDEEEKLRAMRSFEGDFFRKDRNKDGRLDLEELASESSAKWQASRSGQCR